MSATETKDAVAAAQAEAVQQSNPLAGITVKAPETTKTRTRRYFAGIKRFDDKSLDRFQFQIRVGPVCFSTQTFAWKGKGDLAEQVFRSGAVVDLTDAQVEEVRQKLRYRYLRLHKMRDEDGNEFITGFADIDSSDSGSATRNADGSLTVHQVNEKVGVLRGDEIALVNVLSLLPAATLDEFNGQVVTLEMARRIVAEAEAEEKKVLADPVNYMESGKGGLLEKKAKKGAAGGAGEALTTEQEAKRLRHMATTDGKRKAEGGFLAD